MLGNLSWTLQAIRLDLQKRKESVPVVVGRGGGNLLERGRGVGRGRGGLLGGLLMDMVNNIHQNYRYQNHINELLPLHDLTYIIPKELPIWQRLQ